MHEYPRSTTWPYVVLVTGLFLAAVKAPRLSTELSLARLQQTMEYAWRDDRSAGRSDSAPSPTVASVVPPPLIAPPNPWTYEAEIPPLNQVGSTIYVAMMPVDITDGPSAGRGWALAPVDLHAPVAEHETAKSENVASENVAAESVSSSAGEVRRAHDPIPAPPVPAPPSPAEPVSEPVVTAQPAPTNQPAATPVRTEPTAVAEPSPTDPSPRRVERAGRPLNENWLMASLSHLSEDPLLADWVTQIRQPLERLQQRPRLDGAESHADIQELSNLIRAAGELDPRLGTDPKRLQLRQAAYGLRRRVLLWSEIARLDSSVARSPLLPAALDGVAREAAGLLSTDERFAPWRTFVGLDEYSAIRALPLDEQPAALRQLATLVHRRQLDRRLSFGQRSMLRRPAIAQWLTAIGTWHSAADASTRLRQSLELFETDPSGEHGHEFMAALTILQAQHGPTSDRLTELVEEHYRNANIRLSVSTELLNSVLPTLDGQAEQVRDVILGAQVHGENVTWTKLNVTTVDDQQRWHVVLRATGQTESTTASTKGPVTLFSRGSGQFDVEKHLYLTSRGIQVSQARGAADSGNRLTGMRTQFDEIPLMGWMVRRYALQQHDEQRQLVRREVRERIASSAERRLDQEIHQRLNKLETNLDQLVVDPLHEIGMEPRLVELASTTDRLVLRGRLATPVQPAAFTARPQAVEGSLISLQLHQSVWNNLAEQLQLDGQRLALEEVVDRLATTFRLAKRSSELDLPRGVTIEFAQREPISCRFADGRMVVSIHIQQLDNGTRRWKDFTVRGYYQANPQGLNIELVRDGNIELVSDQLGFRDRVALRGIFTKLLTNSHTVHLFERRGADAPELQKLVVTQLHIDHGWLGLALGREAPAYVATEHSPVMR